MEVVCKSDYQDIFRLKEGVLFVVNKFEYIEYPKIKYPVVSRPLGFNGYEIIWKKYCKDCQADLVELTKDYKDKYSTWSLEKGTILYRKRPVKITADKNKWEYQLKTTGAAFGGNFEEMHKLIVILNLIWQGVMAIDYPGDKAESKNNQEG